MVMGIMAAMVILLAVTVMAATVVEMVVEMGDDK
jgi:hypothetical protein